MRGLRGSVEPSQRHGGVAYWGVDRRPRAVSAAVALVMAFSVAGFLVARSSGRPAAAAAPVAGHVINGRATFYSLGDSGLGNCSFPPETLTDRMYVAAGPADYSDSAGCGTYLDVTGPGGKVRVIIADKCPECEEGHLDMSPESFRKIASGSGGTSTLSYEAVRDPALPGPIKIIVKTGSSAYWIGFLVMNHGNPLTNLEYRDASGSWVALSRQVYNYWQRNDGAGPGPFTLRLTDVYGHQVVVNNIALTPDVVQNTGVSMYSTGS